MKKVVLIAWLLLPSLAFAQTSSPEATLNFCGVNLAVPAGCTPESKYELRCDNYQLGWLYLDRGQLLPVVEDLVRTEKKKHKPAEQQTFDGFILDMPAKGYRLSYATETGLAYQLIFYGTAKGQPVVVQLTLDFDPEKTADLPEVARQIVHLSK
ncbi:hypothetical protein KBK19_16165 [Microvirga sp. STR05]|uniref:DUF4251 domain-containing protein n=1 Tax=Hymenobacter duratus TaxID=2771356 RepID=A0ABR8JP58_9BACT|nr:hypothetical protein [Hymenobacter duratus]MBD2716579.1 hypothetical protein [Hymenobacter duratus]MBR7951494.1 hypothetical protein [Microvirga sp. STR05]